MLSEGWAESHARENPRHEAVEALDHPGRCMTCGEVAPAARLKWVDLFGIDPDYCGGKPVDEWLEENRGEA